MVFKKVGIFVFFVFIISCSPVEFVYDGNRNIAEYKNNTKIVSLGGNNEHLISYLVQKIKNNENNSKYLINLSAQHFETVTATNQDQSASSYYINDIVKYELINSFDECVMYVDTIETGFSYNTKSEGYSFGTDKSIEKNKKQNLEQNAEIFLKKISSLSGLTCINENKS